MKVWISRTLLMLSLTVPLGDVQSNPQKKGTPLQVKFIDFEDLKTGVDGDVHYLPFEGGNLVIGHSDSSNSGWAILTRTPKQGESLYLFPESDDYSSEKFRWAPPNMTVAVERSPKSRDAKALLHGLVEARRGSNDAMVALIANDLSTRPKIKGKGAYEQEGYRAAAVSFGIPVEEAITYDLKQKKSVPSDTFTAAVKLFQKENGLATTGQLNYPTLKAKSGANVPEVIANFDASTVRKRNALKGRIAKLTEPDAEAILAAGREHADLNSQFAQTPQDALPARNYLFHLIETADDNELSVWGSIIPVRPAVAATPTPTPTQPSPHQ